MMLILAVLGSSSDQLYRKISMRLSSLGYRVVSAIQTRKVELPRGLRILAEGGAMVTLEYSTSRILISSSFVPESAKRIADIIRCLMPVEPDVFIMVGFRRITIQDEGVVKVLACKGEGELLRLREEVKGDVLGEVRCLDECSDETISEIIQRAQERKYLPSPVKRGI